jgi:hypothetical protein
LRTTTVPALPVNLDGDQVVAVVVNGEDAAGIGSVDQRRDVQKLVGVRGVAAEQETAGELVDAERHIPSRHRHRQRRVSCRFESDDRVVDSGFFTGLIGRKLGDPEQRGGGHG